MGMGTKSPQRGAQSATRPFLLFLLSNLGGCRENAALRHLISPRSERGGTLARRSYRHDPQAQRAARRAMQ